MPEKYLTIEECARELRVNYMTVWRHIHNRSLRAVQFGRKWRIRRKDLNYYLHGRLKK